MSQISVSQAAKLTGKSRETINKATQTGKLAFTRNGANHKRIAVSELERVFDLVTTVDEINKAPQPVSPRPDPTAPDNRVELATLRERVAASEKAFESLAAERQRERRQLESEIDSLRESLQKAQDQHGKALLLITDQTEQAKRGDWGPSLRRLEKRLADQEREQAAIKETAKRRVVRLKRELAAERNKSLFERLFGRAGKG